MNTAINTNKTDIVNIQTILSSKVDKEEGKSLVSDSEIARLANVENYDDTQIKTTSPSTAQRSDISVRIFLKILLLLRQPMELHSLLMQINLSRSTAQQHKLYILT